MTRTMLLIVLAACLFGEPVAAQQRIKGRGYLTFGSTSFSAAKTFEALGAGGTKAGLGGGGTVTGLWRALFLDVGLTQQTLKGQRVFIDSGTVYALGTPLTITMRPLDIAAGWRFPLKGRVSPYVGGGMTFMSYRETASFAQAGDDVSESKAGALMIGGVDITIIPWIRLGGEVRYRRVTGVLGLAGVSAALGNHDVGGFSTALRLSLGR